MTLSKRRKCRSRRAKKENIYNIDNNRVKLNRDIHFTCILRLLNNTMVNPNVKQVRPVVNWQLVIMVAVLYQR
jgi:hypothetical protein